MKNFFACHRLRSTALAGFASWLVSSACAAPTEIKLSVFTDVPCSGDAEWHGIAVYVGGSDQNIENKAPALTSTTCDHNGQIGSLVIVPSGSKSEELDLRVVAGISQNPEDCASHQYQGCIVARRSLRFSPHSELDLEITLSADCRGVGCDPGHTCIDGTCIEAASAPPLSTAQETPDPLDASASGPVRCGDNGVFCQTSGNVCCLSIDTAAGTTSGQCMDPARCQGPSVVLYCDDESDCASLTDDQGHIGMCLLAYNHDPSLLQTPQTISGSQCVRHAGTAGIPTIGIELCEARGSCLAGGQLCLPTGGDPNPLPGYYWCPYDTNNTGE